MEIPIATEDVTTRAASRVENSTILDDEHFLSPNLSVPRAPSTMSSVSWLSYLSFSLTCSFLLVGLVGNGLTLIVTLRSGSRSKPHSILIMSLAVADTLSLLTHILFAQSFDEVLLIDLQAVKAANNLTCKLFNATFRTSIVSSSLMIMLICIERFIVVWFPLKSRHLLTRKVTIISVAACLSATLLIVAIPSAIFGGIRKGVCFHDFDVDGDGVSDTMKTTPLIGIMVVLFAVCPVLVILSLTPLTIFKLYRQHTIRRRLTTQELNTGPYRTSVLLIAVVVAYMTLAGIPNLVFSAISASGIHFSASPGTWRDIAKTCFTLIYQANYSTNFIFYSTINAEFRQQMLTQLGCSCCRGQ